MLNINLQIMLYYMVLYGTHCCYNIELDYFAVIKSDAFCSHLHRNYKITECIEAAAFIDGADMNHQRSVKNILSIHKFSDPFL